MTKEDMIRMAREAGWQYAHGDSGYEPLWAFATLIAQHERETCAKVCEKNATDLSSGDWDSACINCADHIRARGQA